MGVALRRATRLVIASHNEGKVREIADLLAPFGVEAVSAGKLALPEPEETGDSFAENARLKAVAAARASRLPALADDSGLEVRALGGEPGIHSARWGGAARDFGLAMERSFSVGAPGTGNTIKLYTVDFKGATDVDGLDSITGVKKLKTVDKSLLLDLRTLGIPLDNVEGMTLGPRLPDGRRSLVLVSDNNFAASQFTQFLLFALD